MIWKSTIFLCLFIARTKCLAEMTDQLSNDIDEQVMEFFDVSGNSFENLGDVDFEAANIPHSRKRRFLAFPSPSTLTLEVDLTIPVEQVTGISQLVFESDFIFDLDDLFPVPIITTTTTTTTTSAPSYKAPLPVYHAPAPLPVYKAPAPPPVVYKAPAPAPPPQLYKAPSPAPKTSSYASNRIETNSYGGLNRLNFYKYMEDLLSRRGYNGRQCTLRTLCEVAEAPFDHGIYGEVVNMIMAASLSPSDVGGYDDYMAAEFYGRHYGECHKIYPKCPESVLNIVSRIV